MRLPLPFLAPALALLLGATPPQNAPADKQEKKQLEKKIEDLFAKLVSDKDEAQRAAARAELEALGRPVLPILKKFLDDELVRAKKAKEKAETIVDRYVPKLDNDAIETREAATLALLGEGETILPGLKKYEKSPSAEIRARVKFLADTISARKTDTRASRVSADALVLYSRLADPSGAALVSGFFDARDAELRLEALRTFHEIALPSDLPKLKPLLADADLKVRGQACLAAADLGFEAAVPLLAEIVRSERDLNVWRAALAGMSRWRALWTPDITAKIGDFLPGAAPDRRPELLWSYFLSGPLSETPEDLLKVFRKLAPAEKAALLKPWSKPEDPAWLAAVRILASEADPATAGPAAALYGYARFFRFGGGSSFVDQYDSLPVDERFCGICALAQQTQERTFYAVKLLLHEQNPILRKALVQAGFQNPTFVVGAAIKEALQSGQPDLLLACADVTHHNQTEAFALIKYLFQTTNDPNLKAHLGLGLAADGYVPATPFIAPFLQDSAPWIRLRAVEAVGAVQARELMDALVPLLKDPDQRLRTTAAQSLLRCDDPRAFEPLWGLRSVQGMEWAAVQAFGLFGKIADLRTLEKLIDENASARAAAPGALFTLSPMEALPLLQKLAADKSQDVRFNADRELANVKIAAALPQQILDAAGGKGSLPTVDIFSPRVVFVSAADCTPQVAVERHALPIPFKEFLLVAAPTQQNYYHFSLCSAGCPPRACPPEVLEALTPDNPRLAVLLSLLRSRPYPEVGAKLAAFPPESAGSPDFLRVLSWSDPLKLRDRILRGIEQGKAVDGAAGLSTLSEILPGDEHVALLVKLSTHPDPSLKAAADQALGLISPRVLCTLLADGRFKDRLLVLRSLARFKVPGTLPTIEQALKDPVPQVRALAAVAYATAKGEAAVPVALRLLPDADGDLAWELAAKVIVYLKEEHRGVLPARSESPAVQALLARLGNRESAAKVLAEFPSTSAGKLAAGMALGPHFSAAVEEKLLPLLSASTGSLRDRDGLLGLCACLAHSPEESTRARVVAANPGISFLDSKIHPADREALEALVTWKDPGAVRKLAVLRGSGTGREEGVSLLRKIGSDEAAAALLDILGASGQNLPEAPLIVESIKAQVQGPKTREKLQQILKGGTFFDVGLLASLAGEVGMSAEYEAVLEKKAKGENNYVPSLGAMRLLARSPTGLDRLKAMSVPMAASQDGRQKAYGAFAALLSGLPVAADEWRARVAKGGGTEETLLAGQLRLSDLVQVLLRQRLAALASPPDSGLAATLPLLTCQDFRCPEPSQADYWPRMARFLAELGAWTKKNRGKPFEEIFAEALKARGLAVAGKVVGAADAAALVAALDDKDDFIAANADWMLRRISGRSLPAALSVEGDDGRAQELKTKYGNTLVTVTFGTGRWVIRRPTPEEVSAWKAWRK
jgi:HEAT repeat protein